MGSCAKKGWGGFRPGAGRKKMNPALRKVPKAFYLNPEAVQALGDLQESLGLSSQSAVVDYLTLWAKGESEPWYGFKFCYGVEGRTFLDVMDNLELNPDCMIRPFNVGQYILSSGFGRFGINNHGPFESFYDAIDYAEQNFGVNYFYQYSDPDSCMNSDETFPEIV